MYNFFGIQILASHVVSSTIDHNKPFDVYVYITSRGKLIRIISSEQSDQIRASTAALSFPICLNEECQVDLPDTNQDNTLIKQTLQGNASIKVLYFGAHDDRGVYEALTKETLRRTRDRYIRVTEYDHAELHAFIFIRYAWGINITVSFLNVQENICYCLYVFNHDDPDSLALKVENGELYSFDSYQQLDIAHDSGLYHRSNKLRVSYGAFDITESLEGSWEKHWTIKECFERLIQYIQHQ